MGLKDKIKQNLGSGQPATISRAGNMFTLRDAAGNEKPSVHTLDVIFVDGNENVSKLYREDRNFDPNNPTPPDCYSDNSEAPSSFALKPQSDSCATCPQNRRGSATSKVDGKPIKACTDNQKLAVIVADDPSRMIFQLLITPGNLQGFRAYIKTLEGHKYDPEEVVTRLSFVPKSMGVIDFQPVGEVDDDTKLFVSQVAGTAQIKFVTGEDDQPIGALPAPQERKQIGTTRTEPVQDNWNAQQEPAKRSPTREELEAELAKLRAAKEDKPKRTAPKLVEPEPSTAAQAQPEAQIPAFLRRDKPPSNGAFGMTSNAQPIPDEVSKLVAQHADAPKVSPLAERMSKAFGLPLRS